MKVNFIVTQSFLRTAKKTDPFYDPIIRAIEGIKGVDWNVFLWDKGVECGYPNERLSDYLVLERVGIWFYKLCHIFAWRLPSWKIYRLFGILSRPFFAKKFAADVVITQAGQFAEVFDGLLPKARIVDIQHGVIYSKHNGYFDETKRLLPIYQACTNREFWVYGQGYADCFFKHPDNDNDLQGRVKVVGDVIRAGEDIDRKEQVEHVEKKLIVIASQMTTDFPRETLEELKKMYEEVFDACPYGKKLVFRHHPRFGNCIDLSDWRDKYANVNFDDNREWREVFAEAVCLVTVHSTTAFDAAAYGVPIVFLDERRVDWPNVMKGEFEYPYPNMTISELCGMGDSEWNDVSYAVRKWYARYYEQFDADRCLKLLCNER